MNLKHVLKITEAPNGNLMIHLDEKTIIEASRRNSAEFKNERAIS